MPITADAATTVFCAVWSGDPDRWELLRAHQDSLQAQSVDVQVLCVFDDADRPPDWVRGTRVLASQPLTIYQAWNLATQVARTPFVMNLNLDDRLAADAVAVMQTAMADADLVGGDWAITYSQADTDAVTGQPVRDATGLPFDPAWPPVAGTPTRLGSGTGDRGTLGPATMWRRALHERVGYPWAFADGEPIRIVGDLAWWQVAGAHLGARTVRVPRILGHYHSHPGGQAEFRSADEHGVLTATGISTRNYPLGTVEVQEETP